MSAMTKAITLHTPFHPPLAAVGSARLPKSPFDQLAARVRRMLELLDPLEPRRVLVIEPRTTELALQLRSAGRGSTFAALLHARIPELRDFNLAFDRLVIYDWMQPEPAVTAEQLHAWVGEFDVVVAHDVLLGAPKTHLSALMARIATLVRPRGFVVLSEPAAFSGPIHLEALLQTAGCVVAADREMVEGNSPHILITGQRRSVEDLRLIGDIHAMTMADLQAHPQQLGNVVTAYRTVFGGNEWREWMRCTRHECRRQYSRDEVARLDPPDQCECGYKGTLVAYHSEFAVRQQLEAELGDPTASCCYVRLGNDSVEAFSWGYTASIAELASGLAAQNALDKRIAASLRRFLYECGGDDEEKIFRMAEGGVVREVRNPSIMWGLLQRMLQYAFDQGIRVAVGRTSPRTPMYTIFRGLGLQVIYRFSEEAPVADAPPEGDDRVIVAGSVAEILRMIATESDRRLAVRIAHYLRAKREVV